MKIKNLCTRLLSKIFKTKSLKSSQYKYYTFKSIPLANWKECQDGNLTAIRRGFDYTEESEILEEDAILWEEFQDAYIQEFNENKEVILRNYSLRIRLANLKRKYCMDSVKNRILLIDIMQLEEELRKQGESEGEGSTLDECQLTLSRFQGYHLPDTMTAYQFFTLIKNINKHGESN